MTIRKVPMQACVFRASFFDSKRGGVKLAAGDGADANGGDAKPGKSRFAMQPVVSGKTIFGHWYWGNLAMDLSGFTHGGGSVPALLQHDTGRRLGFTDKLEVQDGTGLVAEGPLLDNAHASEVLADSKSGFPWQSSAYVEPAVIEEVQAGQFAEVNGEQFAGPGTIFRQWSVREVSFAALGADQHTAAEAFAQFTGEVAVATKEATVTIKKTTGGNPTPEQLSAEDAARKFETENPEAAAAFRARVAGTALQGEQARVAAIMEAAAPEQSELVAQLVKDGTPLAEAMQKITADLRTRLSAQSALLAQGGNPLRRMQDTPPPPAKLAELTELATSGAKPEEFAKAVEPEYLADASLRDEFPTLAAFAAFRRLELRGALRTRPAKTA